MRSENIERLFQAFEDYIHDYAKESGVSDESVIVCCFGVLKEALDTVRLCRQQTVQFNKQDETNPLIIELQSLPPSPPAPT